MESSPTEGSHFAQETQEGTQICLWTATVQESRKTDGLVRESVRPIVFGPRMDDLDCLGPYLRLLVNALPTFPVQH